MFGIWCVVWSKMFGRLKLYWNARFSHVVSSRKLRKRKMYKNGHISPFCFRQETEEMCEAISDFHMLFQEGKWGDEKCTKMLRFLLAVLGRKLRRWKMYRKFSDFSHVVPGGNWGDERCTEMLWFLHAVLDGKLRRWKTYRNAPIFACCFRQEIEEIKDVQKCTDFCMLF